MQTGSKPLSEASPGSGATLAIRYLAIDDLIPDPSNPRQHSAKQIRQIAKSIETFGFNVPILADADGSVIAGEIVVP